MKKLIIGVVVFFVFVLPLATLAYVVSIDKQKISDWLAQEASIALGRTVRIEKPISFSLSLTPEIVLEKVSIANPPWAGSDPMVEIAKVQATLPLLPLLKRRVVVEHIEVNKPVLRITTREDGTNNFDFKSSDSNTAGTSSTACPILPDIRQAILHDGNVWLSKVDQADKNHIQIKTLSLKSSGNETSKLHAQGLLGSSTAEVSAEFSQNRDVGGKISLEIEAKLADLTATISGALQPQGTACAPAITFDLGGQNLASLNAIPGLQVPALGPITVRGTLAQEPDQFSLKDLEISVAESRASGTVLIPNSQEPLTITLDSPLLKIDDLTPSTATVAPQANAERTEEPSGKLFTATPIPFADLGAINAVLIASIDRFFPSAGLELNEIDLNLKTSRDSLLLTIKNIALYNGTVSGTVSSTSLQNIPNHDLSLNIKNLSLGQLIEDSSTLDAPLSGTTKLQSKGSSLEAIAASLNGSLKLSTGEGHFRNTFLELLTGTLYDLLRPIFGKREENKLHCVVSSFDIKEGVMTSRALLFHTSVLAILGEGTVNLGSELLDLSFKTKSNEPSLASVLVPFDVSGPIKDPSILPSITGTAGELIQSPTTIASGAVTDVTNVIKEVAGEKVISDQAKLCSQARNDGGIEHPK